MSAPAREFDATRGPAAAPVVPASAAGWIRGPAFDLGLILGVFALALLLGGVAMARPWLFAWVIFADFWLLAYPHVASMYTRVAFDRRSARSHWFLLAGL